MSDNYSKHDVEVLTKLTELGVQMTQIQHDIKENNEKHSEKTEELEKRVQELEKWKSKVLGIMLVVSIFVGIASTVVGKWISKLIGG